MPRTTIRSFVRAITSPGKQGRSRRLHPPQQAARGEAKGLEKRSQILEPLSIEAERGTSGPSVNGVARNEPDMLGYVPHELMGTVV
jgi:hypothetical protein